MVDFLGVVHTVSTFACIDSNAGEGSGNSNDNNVNHGNNDVVNNTTFNSCANLSNQDVWGRLSPLELLAALTTAKKKISKADLICLQAELDEL